MDTERIREFSKVIELGSITRAAGTLNIAQSTLSKHMSELEAQFGVQLLERLPAGVLPTAAGNALFTGAADVLNKVSQLEARMQALRGMPMRRLVVASYVGYGPTDDLISLAAEGLERTAPGATVNVEDLCQTHKSCLQMLREGLADAVLSVMPSLGDFEGLARTPIAKDRLVFVARGDSALARREGLALADLAGEVVWVSDEQGQPYCEKVREVLGDLGIPYALFTKPSMAGAVGRDALNVGHGGLGVALKSMLPRLVPRSKVGALAVIDIPDEQLAVQVELVTRADDDGEVAQLKSAIVEAAGREIR